MTSLRVSTGSKGLPRRSSRASSSSSCTWPGDVELVSHSTASALSRKRWVRAALSSVAECRPGVSSSTRPSPRQTPCKRAVVSVAPSWKALALSINCPSCRWKYCTAWLRWRKRWARKLHSELLPALNLPNTNSISLPSKRCANARAGASAIHCCWRRCAWRARSSCRPAMRRAKALPDCKPTASMRPSCKAWSSADSQPRKAASTGCKSASPWPVRPMASMNCCSCRFMRSPLGAAAAAPP
ncbi:conserved hypothetical protein, partial [Ricinus communis]